MRFDNSSEERAIEGVLIPIRWSAGGEVSQLGLMTFDESEYRVDTSVAEAYNLCGYLRKHIRILGRTRGNRIVEVTAVETLETNPPAGG